MSCVFLHPSRRAGRSCGQSRPGVLHKSQPRVKYAPGWPVYCPALVSSTAAVNRRAGGDSAVHQSPAPPRGIPPHTPLHRHTHTDTGVVSSTNNWQRSNQGGRDELPQGKSNGCFALSVDGSGFGPPVFTFPLFVLVETPCTHFTTEQSLHAANAIFTPLSETSGALACCALAVFVILVSAAVPTVI